MSAGGKIQPHAETEIKTRLRDQQQQQDSAKPTYLQLDARGRPQALSGRVLFDPKTDTSAEVSPSGSARQLGEKRRDSVVSDSVSIIATTVAQNQAETYKKQRDSARQKLRECQQQLRQLKADTHHLNQLQTENELLQDQLEKAQDAQLESDRQVAARNVQLEDDLIDAEAEIARMQAAVQVAETEASVAKSRCAQVEKELQQSQGEVEITQRRLATLQQQTPPNELVEKCRNANAVAEELREEVKVLKQNCEASQQESRRLRTQMSDQETRRLQAEKQKDSEVAEGLESVRRANQGIQWREERIHDLPEESSELREKLQQTQERLGAYSEEAVDLQNKFDPDNPPVDDKVLSYVTNKHLWSSRIQATTQPTGYVAQPSEMPSSRRPPQQPDPTGGPRPLNAGATPFQPVAGTSYSTYDPTTVGHSNVRFGEPSRAGLLSSTNTKTTPPTAGRLKMDIPPPEKLNVTKGQASRTEFVKWRKKLKAFFKLSGHGEQLWPEFIPWYLDGYAEEHVRTFLETPEGQEANFEAVMRHIETRLLPKPNAAVTMMEMRRLTYDKQKYSLNEFLQKLLEKRTELKKGIALDETDMEVVKMEFLYKLPQDYQEFITWHDDWEVADVYDLLNWADHYENRQSTKEYMTRNNKGSTQITENGVGVGNEERRSTDRFPPKQKPAPDKKKDSGGNRSSQREQNFGGNDSLDSKARPDVRKNVCYNCGEPGHFARTCRKPHQESQSAQQPRTNEIHADGEENRVDHLPVCPNVEDIFDPSEVPFVRGSISAAFREMQIDSILTDEDGESTLEDYKNLRCGTARNEYLTEPTG